MTITGPTMPSSLPTTMSRSRTGDASSGTRVPFSFSCVKVEAMSATPESAGMSVLCSARTSIEISFGPPGPVPRPLSTKRIGSSAKKPVRMIAPRSPKISQRLTRLGDDREVRVLERALLADERDHAEATVEERAQHRGVRGPGLVGVEAQRGVAVLSGRGLGLHACARERVARRGGVAGERDDEAR